MDKLFCCSASWTVAHQAPLSVGFSRQEYWNRLLFPPPGHLPNPEIEPTFLMSPSMQLKGLSRVSSNTTVQSINSSAVSFLYVPTLTFIQDYWKIITLTQFSSVTQSCPTLCHPMDCSMPGLPVHHQLPEFIQTHVC